MRLRVAPIVEGHGENYCVRTLIERVWRELLGGEFVDVIRPIRGKRHRLVRTADLEKALSLAALRLAENPTEDPCMILLLLDSDDDPACVLGPQLLSSARQCRPDLDVSCVLANVEFETWFVGAARSLGQFLTLPASVPERPEAERRGKSWIEQHLAGTTSYSETLDQPRLTAAMDLQMCRASCPSFDKLCRELEKRLPRSAVP